MANLTKKAIKQSFMKLLNEKPLNKISVREIVEDCGINRNSFYYHYQDIPALMEEIITELYQSLIQKYPDITAIDDCFEAAFGFMLENKKAILHIYNSISRDIFEKYLMNYCEYAVNTYLLLAFGDKMIGENNHKMIVRFLKCELFGTFIDWLNAGMPEEVLDEAMRMLSLCHGLPETIIERCSGD